MEAVKINITDKLAVTTDNGLTLYGRDTEAQPVNNAMSEYGYRYELLATDEDENEYIIIWDVIYPEAEEMDCQCDWSKYTVIAL